MEARPYQRECIEASIEGFKKFRKQLIVVPTGGGKTCIFSWLAERTLPERTLILAHREELIDQAIAKLYTATGIEAGKEKADAYASLSAPVVVASVQTLLGDRRRERWPKNHFGLVVVDEAHHILAASYRKVLSHFDESAKVLGVTATPDRGDRRNLGEYFEAMAAEIKLFDLINAGYLSPITLKSIPLAIDLNKCKSVAGDFSSDDLGSALDPYLPQIAAAIREHASFRRVLAFLPLIATSERFVAACRLAGLRAEHVDGTSEDRAEKLAGFRRWDFDVLSNAMLLTEGFDDPGIDCVCVLRPTRSRPLYCQMIGRGTRPHEDKENLLLLDFLWMHEKHKVARPAHLIAKTEEEAEQITKIAEERKPGGGQGELDLQGLAADATAAREEALAKQLEAHKERKSKFVSADQFAAAHAALDVAEWQPTMKWEGESITKPQERYLIKAGIDPETVRGAGHAHQLLDLFFKGQRLKLASPAQRAYMKRLGHPSPDTATADEARQFFASGGKARRRK